MRFAIVALLASGSCGFSVHHHSVKSMGVSSGNNAVPNYKRDCWQKRPVSLVQGDKVPGAGIDKFEPYKTVLKDGFLETACVKDYLYSFGDKFGDNKFSYKLEKTSNVSIVHYSDHVAKEDQKAMAPKVCFEFCRTVPNMGFFGIVNGRDCYCTPYYKPMESGSSNCDAVCPGEPTLFCGGKDKSTVFSMHMCADTSKDLGDAVKKAGTVKSAMKKEVDIVKGLSEDMQTSSTKLQESFGQVGDSATTNLLQSAKVFAGELLHTAEDGEKIVTKLGDLEGSAKKVTKFDDPKEVAEAETIIEDVDKTLSDGEEIVEKLEELEALASPPNATAGASKQYYPVMYFVDKEQEATPQTCGGEVVAKPIVGGDMDECATACDKLPQECVGFSYYGASKKLCFLFSKFETAFYYTGCGTSSKKFMLLQTAQEAAPFEAKCMAKFSKFDGTSLKPDPSGKSKLALKELTKADRCYK